MITKRLTVLNELGIHARVACKLTRLADSFESRVEAIKEGKKYNLKNVLGVMTLNTKCGDIVSVEIEGGDEDAAAGAIEQLFMEKFGEK